MAPFPTTNISDIYHTTVKVGGGGSLAKKSSVTNLFPWISLSSTWLILS